LFGQQESVPELPAGVQHFDVVNLNVSNTTKMLTVNLFLSTGICAIKRHYILMYFNGSAITVSEPNSLYSKGEEMHTVF